MAPHSGGLPDVMGPRVGFVRLWGETQVGRGGQCPFLCALREGWLLNFLKTLWGFGMGQQAPTPAGGNSRRVVGPSQCDSPVLRPADSSLAPSETPALEDGQLRVGGGSRRAQLCFARRARCLAQCGSASEGRPVAPAGWCVRCKEALRCRGFPAGWGRPVAASWGAN